MKIAIGTMNGAKNAAAQFVCVRQWPDAVLVPLAVETGISDMPLSDDETLRGAENRARTALAAVPDADLGIGMEGGLQEVHGELYLSGWAVIVSRTGTVGRGKSASVCLPPSIAARIRAGEELGPLMQTMLQDSDNKVRHTAGTHGILTGGAYSRVDEFTHALQCALAPFLNAKLYTS